MKKIIITMLCISFMVNAFALKLPNGDNVRTEDVVMDGDTIVEVKLKENAKITTPLKGQQLIANSEETVKFYKSGALKSFKVMGRDYEYQSIKIEDQEVQIYGIIEFYESGALKNIKILYEKPLQINIENTPTPIFHNITFYDSGSSDKFKVYICFLKNDIAINRNDTTFNITSLEWDNSKGGDISSYHELYLFDNGKILSGILKKDTTIKTDMGEFFAAKGRINFWEDGSVKLFINGDTIIDTIAGMKVSIPAETKMSIYKNGKIRSFRVNTEIRFKVGANTYTTIKDNTNFPFVISEDEKIISTPWVSWDNNNDRNFSRGIVVDSFDSKLEPRIIYNGHTGYKYAIYNRETKAGISPEKLYMADDSYLYYQPGDTGEDIWMVYFDGKGIPSTYCVYDKITGERNTEKKQFIKRK